MSPWYTIFHWGRYCLLLWVCMVLGTTGSCFWLVPGTTTMKRINNPGGLCQLHNMDAFALSATDCWKTDRPIHSPCPGSSHGGVRAGMWHCSATSSQCRVFWSHGLVLAGQPHREHPHSSNAVTLLSLQHRGWEVLLPSKQFGNGAAAR